MPWCRNLVEKLTYPGLVKRFPAFYTFESFNAVFKAAHNLSVFSAQLTLFEHYQPIYLTSILIISTYLDLILQSGLFPSCFLKNYVSISFSIHVTCLINLFLLRWSLICGTEYKLRTSSLRTFLNPVDTSSPSCTNIVLSTLFSNPKHNMSSEIEILCFTKTDRHTWPSFVAHRPKSV
jgi:hypothetical protein